MWDLRLRMNTANHPSQVQIQYRWQHQIEIQVVPEYLFQHYINKVVRVRWFQHPTSVVWFPLNLDVWPMGWLRFSNIRTRRRVNAAGAVDKFLITHGKMSLSADLKNSTTAWQQETCSCCSAKFLISRMVHVWRFSFWPCCQCDSRLRKRISAITKQ